jgi:hypothetical protein
MQFALTNVMLWVLGSLAVIVIATNAAWPIWRARRRREDPASGGIWGSLEPLIWLLSALFLLLPPVAALRAGVLSPYFMGLSELDWVEGLFSGGLLAAAIVVITVLGWLVYRHRLPPRPPSVRLHNPWLAPVDAALLQWHWAFYRAGAIGFLIFVAETNMTGPAGMLTRLAEQPLYWGSWLGMALIAVEWALNPFARRALIGSAGLEAAPEAERTVIRMVLAVSTTALFVLTRNFWLSLACHVVAETAIVAFLPVPTDPAIVVPPVAVGAAHEPPPGTPSALEEVGDDPDGNQHGEE